ncbi:MAG: hypothetical protein J1D86_08135 [Alistipes sp.]|nr:hypothetical protein [Alistipes sp.]
MKNFRFFFQATSLLAIVLTVSPVEAKKPIVTPARHHMITVSSNPGGAQVYMNGQPILMNTPGIIDVTLQGSIIPNKKNMAAAFAEARRNSSITLTFVKEGYVHKMVTLEPSISYHNKNYIFDWPQVAHADLEPAAGSAYDNDKTIVAGEAASRVSRDNAGKTALERTILRWYFDSDPQGARIFWRVISSVPDEVKNTNETYLMTTPYEETRSFNIQGLTYENSRDVQIEVKVMKNGYEPQVKRFNVRQAIDQQEISSFFMLVKRDE